MCFPRASAALSCFRLQSPCPSPLPCEPGPGEHEEGGSWRGSPSVPAVPRARAAQPRGAGSVQPSLLRAALLLLHHVSGKQPTTTSGSTVKPHSDPYLPQLCVSVQLSRCPPRAEPAPGPGTASPHRQRHASHWPVAPRCWPIVPSTPNMGPQPPHSPHPLHPAHPPR